MVMDERPEAEGAGTALAGEGALEAVLDRYSGSLMRYAAHLLGAAADQAEDVVQEAFLRLHRQAARDGAEILRQPAPWLFRVAHNLARDVLRRRGRQEARRFEAAESAQARRPAPADEADRLGEMIRREAGQQALAEVHRLPAERSVLLLRVIQDLSLREIGAVTGLSVSTVARHLDEGLKEIARRLKEAQLI